MSTNVTIIICMITFGSRMNASPSYILALQRWKIITICGSVLAVMSLLSVGLRPALREQLGAVVSPQDAFRRQVLHVSTVR